MEDQKDQNADIKNDEQTAQQTEEERSNEPNDAADVVEEIIEIQSPETIISGLKTEIENADEKYMRLVAEFENFKKRNRQENEQRLKYSDIPLAKSLIGNIDNLERALEHSKKLEQTKATDEIIKGLEMISKQFVKSLEERNILKINTIGEDFNPEVHEAIGTLETDEFEEGKVVSVVKSGYKLFDRIICPAVVQVSKKISQ